MRSSWLSGLSLCLLLTACAPKQHIVYDVADVAPVTKPKVNVVLRVRPFDDGRHLHGPSQALLDTSNGNEARLDGKRRCLNGEKYYEPGGVSREVAEAIAQHLARRGALQHVHSDSAGPADYTLRGEVRALYGMQDYHWGSAIGAGFGLIGAAATAGNQSLTQIRIELSKITLFDAQDRVVGALPPVVVAVEGPMPVDAYCWAIYRNVTDQLKVAVAQLADSVEGALAKLSAPTASVATAAQPAAPSPAAPTPAVPSSGGEQSLPAAQAPAANPSSAPAPGAAPTASGSIPPG